MMASRLGFTSSVNLTMSFLLKRSSLTVAPFRASGQSRGVRHVPATIWSGEEKGANLPCISRGAGGMSAMISVSLGRSVADLAMRPDTAGSAHSHISLCSPSNEPPTRNSPVSWLKSRKRSHSAPSRPGAEPSHTLSYIAISPFCHQWPNLGPRPFVSGSCRGLMLPTGAMPIAWPTEFCGTTPPERICVSLSSRDVP